MADETMTTKQKFMGAFYLVGIVVGVYLIVRGDDDDPREKKPYSPPYYPKKLNGVKRRGRR